MCRYFKTILKETKKCCLARTKRKIKIIFGNKMQWKFGSRGFERVGRITANTLNFNFGLNTKYRWSFKCFCVDLYSDQTNIQTFTITDICNHIFPILQNKNQLKIYNIFVIWNIVMNYLNFRANVKWWARSKKH